jgi:ATP-dependent 26S proteasome regulatory subunit
LDDILGSLKLTLSCYDGSPINNNRREEEEEEEGIIESIDYNVETPNKNLDYLKAKLYRYGGPIHSINRRLEEIKDEISEKLSKQNNLEISIDNLLKCTDTIKQMIKISGQSASVTKEKKKNEEEIKSLNSAKYHYENICKILKGSKLVILNKFFSRFYVNKKFYGGLNEDEELTNLSNRFEISLKDVKLFISCKKLLD